MEINILVFHKEEFAEFGISQNLFWGFLTEAILELYKLSGNPVVWVFHKDITSGIP